MEESLKAVRGTIRALWGVCAALAILAISSPDLSVFDKALREANAIRALDLAELDAELNAFCSDYLRIRPDFTKAGVNRQVMYSLYERIFDRGYPCIVPDLTKLNSLQVGDVTFSEFEEIFSVRESLLGPLRFTPDVEELNHHSPEPPLSHEQSQFIDGIVDRRWMVNWSGIPNTRAIAPVELKIYRLLSSLQRPTESIIETYRAHVSSFIEVNRDPETLVRKEIYEVPGRLERDERLSLPRWVEAHGIAAFFETSHGETEIAPALKSLGSAVSGATMDSIPEVIETLKNSPQRNVQIFGLTVNGTDALIVGPLAILIINAFLLFNVNHASNLVRTSAENRQVAVEFPSALFKSGNLYVVVGTIYTVLTPALIQLLLFYKFVPVLIELNGVPIAVALASAMIGILAIRISYLRPDILSQAGTDKLSL